MKYYLSLVFLCATLSGVVDAQIQLPTVPDLQHEWAIANYQLTGDAQKDAFEKLVARADSAVAANPKSADLLIWQGIINSTYAGVKGGLGALKLAKAARSSLEKAIKIDDKALDGSAYASLGTLYGKVPGWPVGFGSDKKAVQLLDKAIAVNSDGMETNFFYADYLRDQKDYEGAATFFVKALAAPPLIGRPIADAGRRAQIEAALVEVRAKLN